MIQSFDIYIAGRVQGVGFRYFAMRKAQQHGIKGYVANLTDGQVFVHAEGDEDAMSRFIIECRKGPAWARVSKLEVKASSFQGFKDFKIERTF